jgi:4-amino-4-deoxy-L-arabinose transferase
MPLWDPDEARFARTSLEMSRSNDLVIPTFGGEPRLVKPPLLHWMHVALFSLFGAHEWVVRLPVILASMLMLLLTAQIAHRRFGKPAAPWAAVLLATMPLLYAVGRQGTLDALLALHIWAIVAYDLEFGATKEDEPRRASGWVYGMLGGLAFLIKGPVGLLLPFAMMLAGRTFSGRVVAPTLRGLVSVLIAWTVVLMPLGLAFIKRLGASEVVETLRHEVVNRSFSGTDHVEPVWYYLPVLFVATMPWFVPLLASLGRCVGLAREPSSRTARYLAAAWVAGLALFTLSQGKSPNYLTPLLPLSALLLSWELARQLEQPKKRIRVASLLASTLGAFALALGYGSTLEGWSEFVWPARLSALALGSAWLVSLPALYKRRPLVVWKAAAVGQLAFLTIVVIFVPPLLAPNRSSRAVVRAVPLLQEERVTTVDMQVPSLLWYLDRVPDEIPLSRLRAEAELGDGRLYLFDRRDWGELSPEIQANFELIGGAGKYSVYRQQGRATLDEGGSTE